MKNFILRSFLLCSTLLFFSRSIQSQQSLTQIGGWNAYVHLPANYASTTTAYPTIIFFPGIGEVGTNAAAVISNGPGAYITQGWNGNVVVDGNTVEFIVISLQPPAGYPTEVAVNQKIQSIKSLYRVDPSRLYLTGLSHGGWCSSTFVTGDPMGGPYTYASQVAAVVEVEGVTPDDNSPYPNLFDNFALSGGKFLGFEQVNDNRGVPTRVNRMNATVPNSAIFVPTNFGGGGHCCWEQFYGGRGTQPGIFSLGGVNQNLYQWLARQTLGATPPPANLAPTANAGTDKSLLLPLSSTTLNGSGTDSDGTISAYSWRKISGPGTGLLSNVTSAIASVTSLIAGVYEYELTVTDNGGATAKDTMKVTVTPLLPNLLPVVSAGLVQTITLPTSSVTLSGTASDADGSISSTVWTKVSGPASGTIVSPNSLTTTVTGLTAGIYVFQLAATDNLLLTVTSTVIITVVGTTPPVAGCNPNAPVTYTIAPTQPGEIYITNAMSRGWKGGDTLKIPAGTYSVIEIDSFGGDPCRDIIIVNSGGLVNVTGSMRILKDVHHVKIIGNGFAGLTYGFKCKNFAFNRAKHFEMSNIEVGPNSGGVGIYGKQDPYVGQPWTHYPNYTSTKITINNCYVHDVAGEGMYIGHTYPSGDPSNSNLIPQRLDSVTISNCIVTNCGWDGIQLSNARNGGKIFGNTVTNFGTADIDGQRAGIISGGNTSSDVYNNTITNGTGNGIQFFGYGVMQCYNNTITNVGNTLKHLNGEESIYGQAYVNTVETNVIQTMVVRDNQFNYPKSYGAIRFWDNGNSGMISLLNNKFCLGANPPANWQSLYIWLQTGFINVNNTLSCNTSTNLAPTASAGSDKTITLPVNTTTLSGSGTDPDGSIAGYAWVKLSGPASGTLANANSATATASGLVAGTYSYQLTVTDNGGATATDVINVIVNPAAVPNQAPAASAGTDKAITLPVNTTTLNGSGSDPDGSVTGYAWVKLSGPASGTLANANSATATASGLVAGTYSYQLTVTDNGGATATDVINVTVNPAVVPNNQAPTANAGTNITITLPANTASLNGSGTDPDGSITGYAWVKLSGPASGTLANANSATATASGLVAGTYSYQLTVTDNGGATATDVINVTVNPAVVPNNQAPTANAGANITITLPVNTTTLSGSGTDPDGSITGYAWVKLSGPASGTLANASSATATASGLVAGTYSYQLTVTDNGGATATDVINVTVNPAVVIPNQAPTANAGTDKTITLPVNTTTLNGSGTDPDGSITGYAWVKLSGPASGTLANANSTTATASGLVAGVYSYQLTVTDNGGATATDVINVTVNPAVVIPNQAPTAMAGADITITLPVNSATLNGIGIDPDGIIAGYAWVKIAGPASGTLANASSASATASGLVAGVYSYQLTVTDNGGATATDVINVTVNPAVVIPNQAPTAMAGQDITITLPVNTASLNGIGIDPDGIIAGYTWVKIAGPTSGTLANANSATATAGGLVAGVYSYQLTVTDLAGATARDTVRVTVNPGATTPANRAPTAMAGQDMTVTLPANTATLIGTGVDPDGVIASYAWVKIAGPAGGTLINANTATATAGGLLEGTYSYQLTVTDNGGATGRDTIYVFVRNKYDKSDAKVYPNPATDVINLELKGLAPGIKTVTLILKTSMGSIVYFKNVTVSGGSIVMPISIANLRSGTYFLQGTSGKTFIFVKKIVKIN